MKHLLLICFGLTLSFTLHAQQKCMLVKFSGDTSYYDQITGGGKTVVCKNDGGEKVKIPATDVSFYTKPFVVEVVNEGDKKGHDVDSTRKCVVADGAVYYVQMENDSVYMVESAPAQNNQNSIADYYIIRKKNNAMVKEIRKDKGAPDELMKYFGSSCPAFDAKVKLLKPKFQKAVFPWDAWNTLIDTYNKNCGK